MIGILYNAFYIENYLSWAVQKYKDNNGEPAKALCGIPVNEASKNFLWGCLHTIEGPIYIYNSSLDQYEKSYKIKDPSYNGALIPEAFFERIENDYTVAYEEESVSAKEEKKSHKVTVRKVTKK